MSSEARCDGDGCDEVGRHPSSQVAPEGWFYLESVDEANPRGSLILLACSVECAASQWKRAPGYLKLEKPRPGGTWTTQVDPRATSPFTERGGRVAPRATQDEKGGST